MRFLSTNEYQKLKKKFPVNARVRCLQMNDPYHPVPAGTEGTVNYVGNTGTVFVNWDNGSTLGLVIGEDSFEIVKEKNRKRGLER